MSEIASSFLRVRHRWLQLRVLRACTLLAVMAMLSVIGLCALDGLYHLPQRPRLWLGLAVLASGAAAGAILLRQARRPFSEAQAALLIEARHPELQGLALAAADVRQRLEGNLAGNDVERRLPQAMLLDADQRLVQLDLPAVVDRRPFERSLVSAGAAAGLALLVAVVAPERTGHELARMLTPWRTVLPTAAELAAQARADAIQEQARQLRLAAERAAAAATAPIIFTVHPGALEIQRGGSAEVACSVSRADGTGTLELRLSDGSWRPLPMAPVAGDPRRFSVTLEDLADDGAYRIAMGGARSSVYSISVYDQVSVSDLHIDCQEPAYTGLPQRSTKGGDIEALVGAVAHLHLTASGPIDQVRLVLDDGHELSVAVHGDGAEAEIPVSVDGGFQLSAVSAKGHRAVTGLSTHYGIHAIPDAPPTISLLYPAIDTAVHPLETIAIAANIEDDVGLKEVRLVSSYALEDAKVERRSCRHGAPPLKQMLAQFTIDLKIRAAQVGDIIIFHVEVEDLKGQQATSDPFVLTVRGYETMITYADGNQHGANGQLGVAYVTLLGALHDLQARKASLTPEQYLAECAHLADLYTFVPIVH